MGDELIENTDKIRSTETLHSQIYSIHVVYLNLIPIESGSFCHQIEFGQRIYPQVLVKYIFMERNIYGIRNWSSLYVPKCLHLKIITVTS